MNTIRNFFGIVTRADTYLAIVYLLLGLPLGTILFSVLVTGAAVGVSMLIVALLGIPILLAMWYVVRVSANVERGVSNALLGTDIPFAPVAAAHGGNVWRRLEALSRERDRWREVWFLLLRFPAGIATFTLAVTALSVPAAIGWAPFTDDYGTWEESDTFEEIASSPWSWLLVPLAVVLLVAALHILTAAARLCAGWSESWLGRTARDRSVDGQVTVSDASARVM
jgi:hypothetical protein